MPNFATLVIRSDHGPELPADFFEASAALFDVRDNQAPDQVRSAERIKAAGFRRRNDLPRFVWSVSTDDIVEGDDLEDHLGWIFDLVPAEQSLADLRRRGYEYELSCYFEGNGTGGGPRLSVATCRRLVHHDLALQIGFYLEVAQ